MVNTDSIISQKKTETETDKKQERERKTKKRTELGLQLSNMLSRVYWIKEMLDEQKIATCLLINYILNYLQKSKVI